MKEGRSEIGGAPMPSGFAAVRGGDMVGKGGMAEDDETSMLPGRGSLTDECCVAGCTMGRSVHDIVKERKSS